MDVGQVLSAASDEIVAAAHQALQRSHLAHYEREAPEVVRDRLRRLCELTIDCARRRRIGEMTRFAEELARQRFERGYDLFEVQTAFNVLEEAMWRVVLERAAPERLAESLGLVATVLGLGKDALARSYVALATAHHAPSLDLRALFEGTQARPDDDPR